MPADELSGGAPSGASPRRSTCERATAETEIRVSLDLDGGESGVLSTGIGFFDHMLDQVRKHGRLGLAVECRGDLHIDAHHTVEDVGIALGCAFAEAVSDKAGITRFAHAYVPLDETLARAVIDVSGRSAFVYRGPDLQGMVGEFPAGLIHDFFKAFTDWARVCVHLEILYGRDTHHMLEAAFKAFGRALGQAVAVSAAGDGVPSTKGVL